MSKHKTYTASRDGQKVRYDAGTVGRALENHKERGYVRSWREPFEGEKNWAVDLYDYGYFQGTIREVHAIVLGLTVAHRVNERREERPNLEAK